ncbi:hypothetical protein BDQ17DRAFT_1437263 [Cyathus striatus]|nr:hypothetical protein BDQ17DRAFT_1437263 [Cyathus striatus]
MSHNPKSWLDNKRHMTKSALQAAEAHANFIQQLVKELNNGTVQSELDKNQSANIDHNEYDTPLEGGPKTAEVPPTPVNKAEFLASIDICAELTNEQQADLARIIESHQEAFGIDRWLGNYEAKVDIPLKPGSKPISVPPFPQSQK